jgi:molybdopterin synthase catalytic subunit
MSQVTCRIVDATIEPGEVLKMIPQGSHGAENIFLGYVRDINLGKRVTAVAYDAFAPLAVKVFTSICEEARLKWGDDLKIYVVHRTGHLQVGEISIGIAVSSRHRDESYLASRFVLEEIKTRAPIWKKEFYENGETDWVRGHALCGHADRSTTASRWHVHPHGH